MQKHSDMCSKLKMIEKPIKYEENAGVVTFESARDLELGLTFYRSVPFAARVTKPVS